MKPAISIIIPAYNCEKYIADCLASIERQTFCDYEILVVDDGSNDRTQEVLQTFAKKNDRIRLFRQKNAGPSAARNTGIRNAAGDYVMFCDADDTIAPHTCEALYSHAAETSAELVLAGYVVEVIQNGKRISLEENYPLDQETGFLSGEELRRQIPKRFEYGIAHSVCGKLFRRECLEKHSLFFDETIDIGEDLLFHLSFFPHVKTCGWVNLCLYHYYYRTSSGSLATRFQQDIFCKKVRLYRETLRFFETYPADEIATVRHGMNRRLFLETKECIRGTIKQGNSFRIAWKQLKQILSDRTLQGALAEIEGSIGKELGFKNSLVCRMMQRRMIFCIYLLFFVI